MAQQAYSINPASEGGAALNTLLTEMFASRDSLNSGTTAPPYAVYGTFWLDTSASPNLLKLYDGASWITLASVDTAAHKLTIPLSAGGTGANDAAGVRTAIGLGALATLSTVGTAQITNAAITTALINDGAVTRAKMAADTGNKGKYLQYDISSGAVVPVSGLVDPSKLVAALAQNFQSGSGRDAAVLMQDGTVRIWGTGTNGNGDVQGQATYFPQRLAWPANATGTGQAFSAAISKIYVGYDCLFILTTDGKVYSLGYNGQGQLGLGDTSNRTVPTLIQYFVTNSITITDIYLPKCAVQSGISFTIFRDTSGNLYSCGGNYHGQLGLGDTTNRSTPTPIPGLTGIAGVSCSEGQYGHVLAYSSGGTAYGWGSDLYGNLGDGTTGVDRTSPITVATVSSVVEVLAAGSEDTSTQYLQSYLRTSSGQVYACGYNAFGELGDNTQVNKSAWTLVWDASVEPAAQMFANGGDYASFGIITSTTGRIYVCGCNNQGQLGLGDTTLRKVLTRVGTVTGATKAKFTGEHNASSFYYLVGGVLYAVGYGGLYTIGLFSGANQSTANVIGLPNGYEGVAVTDFQWYGSRSTGATIIVLLSGGVLLAAGNPYVAPIATRLGKTTDAEAALLPVIFT